MRKYILGVLMLLAYLQPLVANALVFNTNDSFFHLNSPSHFSKDLPSSKSLMVESILIDIDDDDELSEPSSDLCLLDNINSAAFNAQIIKSNQTIAVDSKIKHSSKPLYILWSVFRI